MLIHAKSPGQLVPSYSLTGDLLSFSRCRLQYRYYNQSQLPPSRPVQFWYGEFIHGVLEQAYRLYITNSSAREAFPWPRTELDWREEPSDDLLDYDIARLAFPVENALRQQNKIARTRKARLWAYHRVERLINDIGPHLFPLIESVEQTVIGTREIIGNPNLRSKIYEVHGRIDVVSNLKLKSVSTNNIIRVAIENVVQNLPSSFEVLVDYKGQRRPLCQEGSDLIKHEQQLLTYAWLRELIPNSVPVMAGVLIYVNEFYPGARDIYHIKRNLIQGNDDILPTSGSQDYYAISTWNTGDPIPPLSLEYRLKRSIHVIPITEKEKQNSLSWFDSVVRDIEERVALEPIEANLHRTWAPSCNDPSTCIACDFYASCPTPRQTSNDPDEPEVSPDDIEL